MQRGWRILRAAAVVGVALFLYLGARDALARVGARRAPMPTACYGPEDARLRILYLHGSDTSGPSWIEAQNRRKLRVLAERLGARIALPRAPDGSWSFGPPATTERSLALARARAAGCLGKAEGYGVIAFSYGAAFANELFLRCRPHGVRWIVSAGGVWGVPRGTGSLAGCGRIRVIAGRHEPVFEASRAFAAALAKHGADAAFIEHPGPHELPFAETLAAIRALEGSGGR